MGNLAPKIDRAFDICHPSESWDLPQNNTGDSCFRRNDSTYTTDSKLLSAGKYTDNNCDVVDRADLLDLAENDIALAALSNDPAFQLEKLQTAAMLYQSLGETKQMIFVLEHAVSVADGAKDLQAKRYYEGMISLADGDINTAKKYFSKIPGNKAAQAILSHIEQVETKARMARTFSLVYAVYEDWKRTGEEHLNNSVAGEIISGLYYMCNSRTDFDNDVIWLERFFKNWAKEIESGRYKTTTEILKAMRVSTDRDVREGSIIFERANFGGASGQGIEKIVASENIKDDEARRKSLIDITETYIAANGRRYGAAVTMYAMLEAPAEYTAELEDQPYWDTFRDFFSDPVVAVSGIAPFMAARHLANLARLGVLSKVGGISLKGELLGRAAHFGVFAPSLVIAQSAWQSVFSSHKDIWSIPELKKQFADSYLVFALTEAVMAFLPYARQAMGSLRVLVPKGKEAIDSIELGKKVMPLNALGNVTYGLAGNATLIGALATGGIISEQLGFREKRDLGVLSRLIHEEMTVTQLQLGMRAANRLSSGRLEAQYHRGLISAKVAEIGRLVETMGLKPLTLDHENALHVLLRAHAEGNLGRGQIAQLKSLVREHGQPLGSTTSATSFNRYFDKNGIDLRFGQAYSDASGDIGAGTGMAEGLALAVASSAADAVPAGTQVPERSGVVFMTGDGGTLDRQAMRFEDIPSEPLFTYASGAVGDALIEFYERYRAKRGHIHSGMIGPRDLLPIEFSEPEVTTFAAHHDTFLFTEVVQQLVRLSGASGITRISDLGAGSSIPTISALLQCAKLSTTNVIAIDVDAGALEISRRNIDKFGFTGRYTLQQENMLEALGHTKIEIGEAVIANPPYLPVPGGLDINRYGPVDGGTDGTKYLMSILQHPYPKGTLVALEFCSLSNPRIMLPEIERLFDVLYVQAIDISSGIYTEDPRLKPYLLSQYAANEATLAIGSDGKIGWTFIGVALRKK